MEIFIILSLFYLFQSVTITEINNFEKILYPIGTSLYSYQFSKVALPQGKDAYFYFNFTKYNNLQLKIINESKYNTTKKITYGGEWESFNISDSESQTYLFEIINNGKEEGEMMFIDSTKEINTNLNNFIFLNFSTDVIEMRPPIPLIFNIEPISEDIFYNFKETKSSYEEIYDDNKQLSYYSETEDKYIGFTYLSFEKGQKYKIKLNIYKKTYDERFLFMKFVAISYFFKEVSCGLTSYETDGTEKIRYFLINTKGYSYIYLYVKNSQGNKFYYVNLSEEEKENLIIDKLYFSNRESTQKTINYNSRYDYLIIKIIDNKDFYENQIFVYYFSYKMGNDYFLNLEKGECGLFGKDTSSSKNYKYILSSSKNNIKIITKGNNGDFLLNENVTNIVLYNKETSYQDVLYFFIDSIKEKSTINAYIYKSLDSSSYNNNLYYYSTLYFNFVLNDNLNDFFIENKTDYMFNRTSSHSAEFGFNTSYFFDIKEKYYLYIKKHYGNSEIYQYNGGLEAITDVRDFQKPYDSYDDKNYYKLIENELIILSGYQLFTMINRYNALYDIFIQKVNDFEVIELNPNMFQFNNLVKLLNEKKNYRLNFEVNHLIKLDEKFLDANVIFTDEKGINYILNRENRVIDNLKGNNITVVSTKNALLYFYHKIENYTSSGVIIFDKSQKGKNMKFNLELIGEVSEVLYIVKDFCFEGYYPILNKESWEMLIIPENNVIYIDNILDKLEYDLYEDEGENYIIYLFDSFDENQFPSFTNYKISNIDYFVNILDKESKYNFQVIPGFAEGSLILNAINKEYVKYQLIKCTSYPLIYVIENSNGYFYDKEEYPYEEEISTYYNSRDIYFKLNDYEMLSHTFYSEGDVLFVYSFYNKEEPRSSSSSNKYELSIISLDEIRRNIIRVKYTADRYNLRKYYIIIAKKDKANTSKSFSNICYLANLMNKQSDSIIVKTIYEQASLDIKVKDIDISQLNINENEEMVVSMISQYSYGRLFEYIAPKEYKLVLKEAKETLPEQRIQIKDDEYFFKVEYEHKSDIDQMIIFSLSGASGTIFIFSDNNFDIKIYDSKEEVCIPLKRSGTYYFEFYAKNNYGFRNCYFQYYISGKMIDNIDLTKKLYYYRSVTNSFKNKPNPEFYKVSNIKNDLYVFFEFEDPLNTYYKVDNPFEICNSKGCKKDIITYKFLKDENYTIYVNFVKWAYYSFPKIFFFPVLDETIQEKEEGYYLFTEPRIFFLNLENKKQLTIYFENGQKVYISSSKNKISLDDANNLVYINNTVIHTLSNTYGYNYGIIAAIPSNNDNPTKIIIANQFIKSGSSGIYKIPANQNGIVYFNYEGSYSIPDDEKTPLNNYNSLKTFISPIENMKIILPYETDKESIILYNDKIYPFYVDKYESDIDILIKKYIPRYAIFGILDNYSLDDSYNLLSKIEGLNIISSLNEVKSMSFKIDTNMNTVYEYFNFFISKLDKKIFIYIKNYFGNTVICENETNLIENKDFSTITRPLSTFEGKKSLFNKIYSLQSNRTITGYLGYNSLFNLYVEVEDNEYINQNPNPTNLINSNHAAKYLKKGKEYYLNFTVDHLIRLEEGFDAEVIIYNDENKIILNNQKLTGKFKGMNVRIKSDNNIMVYFYGKLPQNIIQYKIDRLIGKNIEIKANQNYYISYIIDFGFEGYNPSKLDFNSYMGPNIYVENIYDNLKTKLIEGENLYIYFANINPVSEIKYSDNLHNKNNRYNFEIIPKNAINKTLIINRGKKDKIRYQINYCESPHLVNMYYQEQKDEIESLLEFNNESMTIDKTFSLYGSIKLRFESEKDFIFSYSFIDNTDTLINNYNLWIKQRKVENNYTIEVNKKYPNDKNSNLFTINFKPNYKKSATKYIIIIAPQNENNTLENLDNPCYLTKLATYRVEGTKIVDIIDTGENDEINVDIDIFDIYSIFNTYIVNIISQEIRYDKKLNFYNSTEFIHNRKMDIEVEIGQPQTFLINDVEDDEPDQTYSLPYKKLSTINEVLLLKYKLNNKIPITLSIKPQKEEEKTFDIVNKTEGIISFSIKEEGIIIFNFKSYEKTNNTLLNSINEEKEGGTFEIVSTEYPIKLDITKDSVVFDEMNVEGDQVNYLKFNIDSLGKDYYKKIIINNKNFLEISKIVSIKKNYEEYKNINFNYYTFESNTNYELQVKFNKEYNNHYKLESFNIQDFDLNIIQNLTLGEQIYKDLNDIFLIINWTNLNNIEIEVKNKNPKFYIAEINKIQPENIAKEFNNIKFEKLENLIILKPENITSQVLMIEFDANETQINFKENKDDQNDEGFFNLKNILIISAGVVFLFIILIVIFCIIRHIKRKKQNINMRSTINKELEKNEKLLSDI